MNSTRTTSPQPGPGALSALLWGGLVCGALDITAAFLVYGAFGLSPIPLLQGIAAGLLDMKPSAAG